MQILPTLILRTQETAAAVTVNGAHLGECVPGGYLSLPLSDCGDYYIGLWPLSNARHYGIMRKFSIRDGILFPPEEVEGYVWPGGIYEAILTPGVLPPSIPASFPFTVDRLSLENGLTATLYYENGLRFAVEEGTHVRYGATLSSGRSGRLIPFEGGIAALGGDPPTLLILSRRLQERLRVQADEIDFQGGQAACITRLPTILRHERRQIWKAPQPEADFEPEPPEIGFFTHTPAVPAPGAAWIRAFAEAVKEGLMEEAFSYLSPELRDGLSAEDLQAFLGTFQFCRTPIENADQLLGLCSPREDGFFQVRTVEFTLGEEGITDIAIPED